MLLKKLSAAILSLLLIPGVLIAQNQEPLYDEITDILKSDPFNVGILLQSTANFSLKDDGFNNGRRFGIGATRLRLGGIVDGGFNYVLQLDFKRAPGIIDAAVEYSASDQFSIKTGLQKPDIGLDLQPNPGNTDFINRARLIGTMLNSRELGISVSGRFNGFDYNAGIFNGIGLRSFNNPGDRFMYLAKAGYRSELNNGGSLYFGANGALNTTENETVGNTGLISRENRLTYGIFADYRSDSWFGAAEFLRSNFDINDTLDETISGLYITIGNKVTDYSEILVRWDHLTFNLMGRSSNLYVMGLNHQITSLISLQINALAEFEENDESFGLAGSFQFQF
ncbi:hypothetical protein BH23BAC3_BH23BAC3_01930 [soil metagenome]